MNKNIKLILIVTSLIFIGINILTNYLDYSACIKNYTSNCSSIREQLGLCGKESSECLFFNTSDNVKSLIKQNLSIIMSITLIIIIMIIPSKLDNNYSSLIELKKLLDEKIISEQEYKKEKKKLLN